MYDEFCPAAARGGGGAGVISLSLSLFWKKALFNRLLLLFDCTPSFNKGSWCWFSLSIFFLDIKKKNISVGFLTSKTTVITTEYSDIDCSDYEELYRSANLFQTWLVGFRDWLVNEVRVV